MARPLYIFDLDGTLVLIDHRRPILDDVSLSAGASLYGVGMKMNKRQ